MFSSRLHLLNGDTCPNFSIFMLSGARPGQHETKRSGEYSNVITGAVYSAIDSRSANANQMRLILHTAAYWLLWRIQRVIPKTAALAKSEFATLRLQLLKVAARVMESASRIRIAFASACPDADLLRAIVLALKPAPT